MAIRSKKNLYPGINPHLNSALQQPHGGWKDFHTTHITHLREALDTLLPSHYIVHIEKSLQLSESAPTVVDVLISKYTSAESTSLTSYATAPVMVLDLDETIQIEDDEDALSSLVVFEGSHPVTRIELLSPANKLPGGSHNDKYMSKRLETLKEGLRLVEIDYLHERKPILEQLPSYMERHANAYPYYIIVSDPRPQIRSVPIYAAGILDPLPRVDIPLSGKEAVTLDLGEIYHRTFASARLYWNNLTDYSQLPANFDSYTPQDQEKVRTHMAQIATEQP